MITINLKNKNYSPGYIKNVYFSRYKDKSICIRKNHVLFPKDQNVKYTSCLNRPFSTIMEMLGVTISDKEDALCFYKKDKEKKKQQKQQSK